MVVKFNSPGYNGCEFYIDSDDIVDIFLKYLPVLQNDDINSIITEYYILKYDECFCTESIICLLKKKIELLQSYNLDGIIYYLDLPSFQFEIDVCKKILNTFLLFLNYLEDDIQFDNQFYDLIKEDLSNNINIFSHVVKTQTYITIV
jgi:hypothetical protein